MATVNTVPKDLLACGFEMPDDDPTRRMIVNTEGFDKSGKSRFWMTAPDPIAGINLDIGLEGVIQKHTGKKKLWVMTYNIPSLLTSETERTNHKQHFFKVKKAIDAACNNKDVRTVVIDTGTAMWECIRLAEFGSLNPVTSKGSLDYVTSNSIYEGLIKQVYNTDKNMIITHTMDKLWTKAPGAKASEWDGKSFARQGYKGAGFLVQTNLRHHFDPVEGKFRIEVLNCRDDYTLVGMEFGHDNCTFTDVATTIYPDTEAKDWK